MTIEELVQQRPGRHRIEDVEAAERRGRLRWRGIFAVVWLMRGDTPDTAPTTNLFLLEVVALALGSVAGWLGGELVDRLGVGVDDGAHLDAPSSLSGRPARQR